MVSPIEDRRVVQMLNLGETPCHESSKILRYRLVIMMKSIDFVSGLEVICAKSLISK
jgi:hypothetical protein